MTVKYHLFTTAVGSGAKTGMLPTRYTLAILLWLCNISLYLARTCMSVAVLKMYGSDDIEGQLLSAFYWGYAACKRQKPPNVQWPSHSLV